MRCVQHSLSFCCFFLAFIPESNVIQEFNEKQGKTGKQQIILFISISLSLFLLAYLRAFLWPFRSYFISALCKRYYGR